MAPSAWARWRLRDHCSWHARGRPSPFLAWRSCRCEAVRCAGRSASCRRRSRKYGVFQTEAVARMAGARARSSSRRQERRESLALEAAAGGPSHPVRRHLKAIDRIGATIERVRESANVSDVADRHPGNDLETDPELLGTQAARFDRHDHDRRFGSACPPSRPDDRPSFSDGAQRGAAGPIARSRSNDARSALPRSSRPRSSDSRNARYASSSSRTDERPSL